MYTYQQDIYEQLREFLADVPVIDTHEHLVSHESSRNPENDVLTEYLWQYFSSDLVSAGCKDLEKVKSNGIYSIEEKWKMAEPYWNVSRYTGYGRALDRSARGLYGVDGISGKTIAELNDKFIAARKKGGHYDYVLKEKCHIERSILDFDYHCDRKYFCSAVKFEEYNVPPKEKYEKLSFDEYLQDCEKTFDALFADGCAAFKSVAAYFGGLDFTNPSRKRAEELYNARDFTQEFTSYMIHFALRYANERNLPFQFHTGIHEGNGNMLGKSNPILLNPLFLMYPNVRFDVFHIGYPFQNILISLCKNFPNVYIDMCWANIISPNASVQTLLEALDAVPYNKIFAFGGDFCFVDGVYGHLELAKDNVAKALSMKIQDGIFDLDAAKQIAHALFYDNPKAVYPL